MLSLIRPPYLQFVKELLSIKDETMDKKGKVKRLHFFYVKEYHTSALCRECHITTLKMVRSRLGEHEQGRTKMLWGVKSGSAR